MMICKADFEDLFPELFPPEPEPAVRQMEKPSGADQDIARPEDDRGQPLSARRPARAASARQSEPSHDMPELARAGAVAAIMPAAAAYASALTMLSGYHG